MKKKLISAVIAGSVLMFGMVGSAQAFELAFDGFCDGLSIDVGADLAVTGSYNGCRGSAVSGNINFGLMPTQGLAITATPNETTEVGPHWTYIVNVTPSNTWCLYIGGSQFQCGTWSAGVPAAAAAGAGASGE